MIALRALPALPRHRRSSGASRSTALFYATPVLYPIEIVSGTLRDIIALNPLTPMFELARKWVIDPTRPARSRRRTARCWRSPAAHLRRGCACSRCGCSGARRRGSPRSCDGVAARRGRRRRRRGARLARRAWSATRRLQARGVATARAAAQRAADYARAHDATSARRALLNPDTTPDSAARSSTGAAATATQARRRCSRTCCGASPTTWPRGACCSRSPRDRDPAPARRALRRARAGSIRSPRARG